MEDPRGIVTPTRTRSTLRFLAGLPAATVAPGAPLPLAPDLWPACLEACEHGETALPEPLRARCEALRRAHAVHGLRILSHTRKLGARLARAGIRSVPIKGAALLDAYPSPGLRPLADVDLLLPEGSLSEASRLLEEDGHALDARGFRSHTTLPLRSPDGLGVDLHTCLFNTRIPLWRELTRESPRIWWEEVHEGRLPEAAHFVMVAAHAMKHWLVRGRWLMDLAVLWRLKPDPGRILAIAEAQGMSALLRVPLAVLAELVGAHVPAALRRAAGRFTGAETRLLAQLLEEREGHHGSRLARFLPLVPGVAARLRVLVDTALPSPREVRERFGRQDYGRFLLERWIGGSE